MRAGDTESTVSLCPIFDIASRCVIYKHHNQGKVSKIKITKFHDVSGKFIIFPWATFIALLGHMPLMSSGLTQVNEQAWGYQGGKDRSAASECHSVWA